MRDRHVIGLDVVVNGGLPIGVDRHRRVRSERHHLGNAVVAERFAEGCELLGDARPVIGGEPNEDEAEEQLGLDGHEAEGALSKPGKSSSAGTPTGGPERS